MKAKPVIYPIMASAKLNSEIAVDFRDKMQRGLISFLIDDNEAETYLTKTYKEFANVNNIDIRAWMLMPYIETGLLVNETINLEYTVVSGNIKLETTGSARKDRYTSCSYGNFVASILEKDLLRPQKDNIDISKLFNFRQPVIRKR